MQLDDVAAVAEARDGNQEAFRVLVDRHSRSLYRIAFNCSVDFLRARPRREAATGDEALERLAAGPDGPTMDDLVYAGQIGEQLQVALCGLSEKERAAFLMRHYHGYSIEEIGTTLGMKTNATKHSIFRAVRKMRVALQGFAGGR